jgi:hypothetical protein
LHNATLQILPEVKISKQNLPKDYVELEDGFYIINKFSNDLGIVSGTLDLNLTGRIKQIRIHIADASETWIILSEIDFSTTKASNEKKKNSLISLIQSTLHN